MTHLQPREQVVDVEVLSHPRLLLFTMALIITCPLFAVPKPKHSIKKVMRDAIKGHSALVKKACKGSATPEELAQMVDYFKALCDAKPPKGELDSWKTKTDALHQAALAIQKDPQNRDLSYRLEQAVECRQCHNPHKPE